MSATDPAARDRMIVEAMRTGMTRLQASVLTDVSKHAFDEAMGTAQRILDSCPPELRLAAFASVLASFATVLREKLPQHWDAFVAAGSTCDTDTVIVLPGGDD
jgi:hypothetical protein